MTPAEVDAIFSALDGSAESLEALLAHVRSCVDQVICPICLGGVRTGVLRTTGEPVIRCDACQRGFPAWFPDSPPSSASPEMRKQVSRYWRSTWALVRNVN